MKLQDVCEVYSGYALKEFHDSDEGYPVIKIGNICSDGTLDLLKCQFTNDSVNVKYFSKKGDIYVALSGATTGKIGIINTDDQYIINQRVGIVRKIDKEIPDQYIKYFLMNKTEKILEDASGCAQPNISPKQIGQYEFPKVGYSEMNNISGILDSVSNVITQRKQELQKLDELIKARFVELFGKYEYTTTISRYVKELRGGKSLAGTEPCENRVLKTGAATFGWFDPEQYKYLPVDYEPLPEHKVETGDVIISRMNTPELVGACSYVFEAPENMYYPDRLWKVILAENTNPIFLWQLLWDPEIRRVIKEKSGGTSGTMHNISKPRLLEIKCMDVPINLQNTFADFVVQVDKSKVAVQKALDEAQLLFDSLMQKYFG